MVQINAPNFLLEKDLGSRKRPQESEVAGVAPLSLVWGHRLSSLAALVFGGYFCVWCRKAWRERKDYYPPLFRESEENGSAVPAADP